MQKPIYKIKEFFKELINPYYKIRKEQEGLSHRRSILEKLAREHGSVSLVPFEEFEKEAGITKERNDVEDYIPCF